MHFFVFFLCFFSPLFAHTTEFFTRTEVVFETSENRHCYSRSSPLEFSRILLQSKILAEGVNAKAFPPDAGLEWLQTQENLSIFTLKNGFSWENFQFPHSFEIEYQTLENGEILAKALSHKVPWGHYPFSVLLELRHGDERKILHHGALETPLCFVEYLAGGLRVADFYSTDRNPENQLSFIRAGVALEGIKLSDLALGKYELVAEFRGIQDVLFAQGKYHFEIVPEDWVPPEKNLFLEVEVPQIMDKQGNLILHFKDGYGKPILSLEEGYIRQISIFLSHEKGTPEMKDEAVLDFRWNTLPPVIQPQLPFKIRFDKMWLRYFGDGTLLYKFTVVRVYLHNEEQSIEGSFQVKTK